MNRLLILAYGNPLRGDDGAAWHIAQALQDRPHDRAIAIVTVQQLTPELAEQISHAEAVIFVDASANTVPGLVALQRVQAAPSVPTTWTHVLDPQTLLALSRQLYGKTPARTFLLSVGGESFEFSEELSAPVHLSIPEAVNKIEVLLTRSPIPTAEEVGCGSA
jgi:hydrogenase maturation protease